LVGKLLTNLVLQVFAGRFFRDVEAGRHGSAASRAYAWTKGRKTWIAFLVGLAAAAATQFLPEAAPALTVVTVVLGHAGLVDKGSRAAAPLVPDGARDSLQWILATAASASYLVFGLQELLGGIPGCPQCSTWSDRIGLATAALGVATSWLAAYVDPGKRVVTYQR
jgi:hypothetical protein